MAVKNPYTPAPYPTLDSTDTDLPPEVKAQLDYARALGQQAQPMAEPEAPAPGVRVPFLNRTIPGRFIDAASPALLSALRSRGPAVRAGKNHDLANVASVIGQAYLGSRVSGAQDRARAHAEDLALAKEQRTYQHDDKVQARREAASMLASWRHEKNRPPERVPAVPLTPDEQVDLARRKAKAQAEGRAAGTPTKVVEDNGPDYSGQVRESRSGVKWLDTTNLPSDAKGKNTALQYANEHGLHIVDKNNADRLVAADEVYRSLDDMEQMMGGLLAKTPAERATVGGRNVFQAMTQQNSDAAAFKNTQVLGIRVIQALAAGAGSGFRLNQAEINMINQRWPKLTDDIATAQKKLEWERRFLHNKERAFFGLPYEPLPRIDGLLNPRDMPEEPRPVLDPKALLRFKAGVKQAYLASPNEKAAQSAIEAHRKQALANGATEAQLDAAEDAIILDLPAKEKK